MSKPVKPEGSVFKNIIIGITTSVLGATAIYFLGFNNKKPSFTKLQQEEITTDAWKSYITVQNIYTKAAASLFHETIQFGGSADLSKEMQKESEKFQNSLKDLIATDGVDREMVSLLKRRLDEEQKQWPETEKFYKSLDAVSVTIKKANWSQQQVSDTMTSLVKNFTGSLKEKLDHRVTDIEDISKALSKKYDQPFATDDLLIVQAVKYKKDIFNLTETEPTDNNTPAVQSTETGKDAGNTGDVTVSINKKYLTGKWNTSGAVVTLEANGQSSWLIPATNAEAKGTWEFKNNQLLIHIKRHPVTGKNVEWIFAISNPTTSTCTITKTVTPFNTYKLVRQ